MKKEFPIEEQWLPYEVHPETPQSGVLLKDYFPDMDPERFFAGLDTRGKDMQVRFGTQHLMANSRLSLEAGEFAREKGLYHQYHAAVFKAYFTECRDIGDRTVLLDAAAAAGLDVEELGRALDRGTYTEQVVESTREAQAKGVRAAPTFFIQGYGKITGAQPTASFRAVFHWLAGGAEGARPVV